MEADPETLRRLAERVGAFHLTDRSMVNAQRAIETALSNGDVPSAQVREYQAAVTHYFGGFEREARAHLRDVDRRLERANQIVFNLAAERSVAGKRVEATADVLALLDESKAATAR